MVTVVQNEVEIQGNQISQPAHEVESLTKTTVSRATCRRCNARMFVGYYEPECLQCGWVDYTSQQEVTTTNNILSSATKFILRYVGDSNSLSETLTHVKVVRLRNRAVYGVTCPFCDSNMEQTSLSGKLRELREQRYECETGHRVALCHSKKGELGWK
jgi:Zn ribbon nucleic-acid-binding protein